MYNDMKTINSFRSKLLALTLALMASVSSFAYDYHGDLLCYNILTDSTVAVTGQSEYKTNYIKKLTKKVYFYAIDDTKPSTYG